MTIVMFLNELFPNISKKRKIKILIKLINYLINYVEENIIKKAKI